MTDTELRNAIRKAIPCDVSIHSPDMGMLAATIPASLIDYDEKDNLVINVPEAQLVWMMKAIRCIEDRTKRICRNK
jgi:hypothetical protein